MNTDLVSAKKLAHALTEAVPSHSAVHVAVCPPAISLDAVFGALRGSNIRLGAQNMHAADKGAYTGEVSAAMLRSVGCHYVILGHSERRQYFGETDAGVNAKTKQALDKGLVPIVCVGETLDEREAGREQEVVRTQVVGALNGVDVSSADTLVIAYEPVWAIGTGVVATPEQAQAMHAFIRGLLQAQYGDTLGKVIHILYGGSMKPDNAEALCSQPDVDGGLIGGASLKAESFAQIIAIAEAYV